LLVGAFFLVIDIVINSSVSYYGTIHYENFYMGFIAVTNILCCAVSLFFIYELAFRTQLKNDLEQIEKIKKAEEEQYQLTKETIDLVNIKCHDLKHQIRDIGAKDKINPETIESISKLIKIYDSSIKTGNKALDTILTEKSLLCNQRGIKFSCIADGEQLKFMSEEDTYSFFGNIIDNAIEAVSSLDEEQRIISIKIISHGNMVSISEHNPYKGEITFTNGLPNSTKNDVNYHGFGTRSIVRVCNKYNGSLSIDSEGHQYSITALFIVDKKTND
ncbi:MAG: GHKL domain-containing protein, partial [Bacilli bacterium]